jgi:DNA-directed RNA polymerase specialized sigma54-like protein
MVPQLELALRVLSLSRAAFDEFLEEGATRLGVLRQLGEHEEDPLEVAERADAAEEGRAPWSLSRARHFDSLSAQPDVWVTSTPPVATANGAGPRYVVIDSSAEPVTKEAQWLLRAARQRARTFEHVAAVAVAQNHHFFSRTVDTPRLLSTRQVAQAAGLHESTIERVAGVGLIQSARGLTRFDELITLV